MTRPTRSLKSKRPGSHSRPMTFFALYRVSKSLDVAFPNGSVESRALDLAFDN